ncbi:NAD binding domain of 6-phosphogluconate dehydrogenase-domain-containing protein [Thermothelomyces heterothallicus CBS 202.75]|uniref:NAD binding domain of 6-phosphogluconate dehydrogenase-domain-containing protein n=1 Tax=Thermothelomyces heterothallicus CBS 202.75 TaxID=1149848 RepID=UPI0037430B3B
MAPKVFWIGLGNMGRGMAKNVVEKAEIEHPVLIYNRTKQRSIDFAEKLPAGKTEISDSIPEGVAKADVIFTILAKDDIVETVVDKILEAGDVKGKLFVECSTIHPDTTARVAKRFLERGAEFVAAPVFGAPAMAEVGQLVGVLAGPRASVEKARQFFKGVMARSEIDMSDEPYEKALTLKLIGNTFILNMVEQLSEGLVLSEKSGLGTQYLHQFVENIFPGPFVAYSNRIQSGAYHRMPYPLFPVDLARKDARHAFSLAEACGVRMRNLEVADAHLAAVKEHDGEKGDIAGIYGALRAESGLKYENN